MNRPYDVMPERLAENVIRRFQESASEVSAFWITVDGPRESTRHWCGRLLLNYRSQFLSFVDAGFNNPNAVAADLIGILETNRERVNGPISDPLSLNCGVILLGRVPLSCLQSSSPVRLPGWFPARGRTNRQPFP